MSILISAIIPTHNRVEYLLKAIDSLLNQSLQKEFYEIIVVDNNSRDETRNMVSKKCSEANNLHYLYEPIMGLNVARNKGWKNARGKYIAYMDDDAIVSKTWLEKIVECFENIKPMPGVAGGKIEPIWESEKPEWLTPQLEPYLTILDWSPVPKFLEDNEYLAGANISFPKSLLSSLDGFQVGLDRVGTKLISNGEISLLNQIRKAGYKIYYDPLISVQHLVPKNRMSISWFQSRFFWQGYSDSLMWQFNDKPTNLLRIKSLSALLFGFIFNYHNWMPLINNDPKKLHLKLDSYYKLGKIKGLITNTGQN